GRGFVEKIGLMAEDLEQQAAELFESLPARRLWVTELLGDVGCLSLIPADNKLTDLDLCGNALDADALRDLAGLSTLAQLRALGVLFTGIEDEDARPLCELPFFQRLSLLRCGGNPLSDATRQRLHEHFGHRVSFLAARDADHLYSIQNERFITGFGGDHTQI